MCNSLLVISIYLLTLSLYSSILCLSFYLYSLYLPVYLSISLVNPRTYLLESGYNVSVLFLSPYLSSFLSFFLSVCLCMRLLISSQTVFIFQTQEEEEEGSYLCFFLLIFFFISSQQEAFSITSSSTRLLGYPLYRPVIHQGEETDTEEKEVFLLLLLSSWGLRR